MVVPFVWASMRCFISRLSYAVVKVLLNIHPKLSLRLGVQRLFKFKANREDLIKPDQPNTF